MSVESDKLLYDVATAAEFIRAFSRGHTLEDYQSSALLRSACERQLEIIGEAMVRLRDRHPDVFASVPDATAIIGFRNRLIHGYDVVDPVLVWDVIQRRMEPLETIVRRLLGDS